MKQIALILILIIMNQIGRSQKWLDTRAYPFKNNYISLSSGQMHYVDEGEGEGEIILFVHGTPTWSFLYRGFISELSKKYRCIAIDHVGFGLSEKPENFTGTPEAHSKNVTEFIKALDLENITLVVHDFGGPIGLSSAIQNNERIKQVVLFNTWLWETKTNPDAMKVDKVLQSRLGQFLYLQMNFSPNVLLKKGFDDKKKLTSQIHKQYKGPFPNKSSRWSLLNLGKSLVGSSDWYQEQWIHMDKIDQKPWLILWGTKDTFITMEYLQKWSQRVPNAKVVTFECGHFVQEEKMTEAIQEIEIFMISSNR